VDFPKGVGFVRPLSRQALGRKRTRPWALAEGSASLKFV
jgi:hypothetical protein